MSTTTASEDQRVRSGGPSPVRFGPPGAHSLDPPVVSSERVSLRRRIARRFADQPAWAVMTELFIAMGWARAAASKVIDPTWWNGEYLRTFLAEHQDLTLSWYQPFIDSFVAPNVVAVSALVLVLQAVAAVCLMAGPIIGRRARWFGLGLGITMNLHFVAAGAVNPSAFYLVAQGALALWLIERASTAWRRAILPAVAAIGLAVAGFSLPFVSTLDPAAVIDDPAIMFATFGGLTALASGVALTHATD